MIPLDEIQKCHALICFYAAVYSLLPPSWGRSQSRPVSDGSADQGS